MNKTLDQIQAEFHQDAETLATLQTIYADKVKQIRTNRALPPDIQQRFLIEWEQFYDQRLKDIFAYNGMSHAGAPINGANAAEAEMPTSAPAASAPAPDYGVETIESRPKKSRA